jgi:hypothetical protein
MSFQKDNRNKDTGLAVILILLLVVQIAGTRQLVLPAIIVLLLVMVKPSVFRPLSVLWFGLSETLGTVSSKVILTLLYYSIVTPVGLIRQMARKDSMQARNWRNSSSSVFHVRDHRFTRGDMDKPY